MPVAIVTGASMGLGKALSRELAAGGWSLVIDARDGELLDSAAAELREALTPGAQLRPVAGDVSEPAHRRALAAAAAEVGGLDLLVNNASALGPSPMPALGDYPLDELRRVYEVNVVAPLALFQEVIGLLRASGDPRVLNVTSDASVEHYETWGGYGSAKAALDHLSGTLAAEEPGMRVWAVDPGDMRTRMHQDAFPGEDISDRPPPEEVAPVLAALVAGGRPSGRYRASELVDGEVPA